MNHELKELFEAIKNYENIETIKISLDRINDINKENDKGQTALYVAIANDNEEAEKLLISKGANKNKKILELIKTKGSQKQELPAASGDIERLNKIDQENDVIATDKYNATPLHLAAASGDIEKLNKLIDNGENVNAQDNNGNTPLHVALQNVQNEIVKELLNNPKTRNKIDINIKDNNDRIPLHLAVINQKELSSDPLYDRALLNEVVSSLIKGENYNERDKDGNTPKKLGEEIEKNKLLTLSQLQIQTDTEIFKTSDKIKRQLLFKDSTVEVKNNEETDKQIQQELLEIALTSPVKQYTSDIIRTNEIQQEYDLQKEKQVPTDVSYQEDLPSPEQTEENETATSPNQINNQEQADSTSAEQITTLESEQTQQLQTSTSSSETITKPLARDEEQRRLESEQTHYQEQADSTSAESLSDSDEKGKTQKQRNSAKQQDFKNKLLKIFPNKCLISGISEESVLEACHIKPYKVCEKNKEKKYSRNNGIILTANHHKLFDKHKISFNVEGELQISESFKNEKEKEKFKKDFFLNNYKKSDIFSVKANNAKQKEYLKERFNMFNENEEKIKNKGRCKPQQQETSNQQSPEPDGRAKPSGSARHANNIVTGNDKILTATTSQSQGQNTKQTTSNQHSTFKNQLAKLQSFENLSAQLKISNKKDEIKKDLSFKQIQNKQLEQLQNLTVLSKTSTTLTKDNETQLKLVQNSNETKKIATKKSLQQALIG